MTWRTTRSSGRIDGTRALRDGNQFGIQVQNQGYSFDLGGGATPHRRPGSTIKSVIERPVTVVGIRGCRLVVGGFP